jgi:hypothetical protein
MTRLPASLVDYWDSTDNFDDSWQLISASDFDGMNNFIAFWNCPECDDFWKASITTMKQRIRKHPEKYSQIFPCKYCNPYSDKGNWDDDTKRCHADGRDTVEVLHPEIASQWATMTINGIEYPLNEVGPDEIVPGKDEIILRCNQTVDEHGKIDPDSIELCNHLRPVRIRTVCNPGGARSAHKCGSCAEGGNDINNFDRRNSLTNTNPDVARELIWHPKGLTADEIRPGSDAMCRWRCEAITYGKVCHHVWEAQVNPRTGRSTPGYRSDCPACVNDVVHEDGRNSLATLFPFISLDWNYDLNNLTPEEVCPGWSSEVIGEVNWRCQQINVNGLSCLHEWPTSLASRTQSLKGIGHLPFRLCPECNPGNGFNNSRDGYYYSLRITGPSCSIVKSGITNVPSSRMATLSYSLNQEYPDWNYSLESIHKHSPSPIARHVRNLETALLRISEIRVEPLEFDGGHELFTTDAFAYAESHDLIVSDEWEDVTDEMLEELNYILHRFLNE